MITGTIKSIEIKTRRPFNPYIGRYSPNTEYLEFYADVALDTGEDTVYFKSPGVMRTVSCGGPIAIVSYRFLHRVRLSQRTGRRKRPSLERIK